MKGSLFSLTLLGFLPPPHQQAGVLPNFLPLLALFLWPLPHPWTNPTGYLGEGGLLSRQAEWELLASRPRPQLPWGPGTLGMWARQLPWEFFAHEHTSPARQLSAQDARDPGSLARVRMLSQSRHRHRG